MEQRAVLLNGESALADLIAERQAEAGRVLVTLDGPCASGKTTLARRLGEAFHAPVVHTDDFVIPHERKTPERLAVPGGNCDAERLAGEVAAPWKAGVPVWYRIYDFRADRLLPPRLLPESAVLILEGSYYDLPPVREDAKTRKKDKVSWPRQQQARTRRRPPVPLLHPSPPSLSGGS